MRNFQKKEDVPTNWKGANAVNMTANFGKKNTANLV
jgi:hypothetical protein